MASDELYGTEQSLLEKCNIHNTTIVHSAKHMVNALQDHDMLEFICDDAS